MSRNDLQNALLDRAEGKLPSDDDSPWAKFDYLKLRETLEAIVSSVEATTQQTESPPDSSPMKTQPEETLKAPFLKEPQEPAA